jgi:hypothetical protein
MVFVHRDEADQDPDLRDYIRDLRSRAFCDTFANEAELVERVNSILLVRAQQSLAVPHIKILRLAITKRISEWRSITHVSSALEPAFSVLEVAQRDLATFVSRQAGLTIAVDTRVYELAQRFEILTRDADVFFATQPWEEADDVLADLARLRDSLPERDDLL